MSAQLPTDDVVFVLSDVHLGSPWTKLADLTRCLEEVKPKYLIIAGDLFEKEHREVDEATFALLMRAFLNSLRLKPRTLVASLGRYNHDPILPRPLRLVLDGVEIYAGNHPVRLHWISDIVVVHGDFLIPNGSLAHLIGRVTPTSLERAIRRALSLNAEDLLVSGHTHVPVVKEKYVNPGSWKAYGIRRTPGLVVELSPKPKPVCRG